MSFIISSAGDPYNFLKVEKTGKNNNVALIYLNRPDALNALNNGIIGELTTALEDAQEDQDIGAIVITGSGRAFAGIVSPSPKERVHATV